MTSSPFLRLSSSVDPRVEAIRAWGNGASMQDGLANTLRRMVFDSIISNIDWDMAGLVQGYFAATVLGAFQKG